MRILGIDPGSRITGYGIIDVEGDRSVLVEQGCIRLPDATLPERLKIIFDEVSVVVQSFQPTATAIESVFMNKNAASALKLGQARGAAICALATGGLVIGEYSPAEVKQAIVGRGRADKTQVAHMVGILLNHREALQADAADALAVALCHSHWLRSELLSGGILRRSK